MGVKINDLNIVGYGKLNGSSLATVNDISAAIAAHVAAYH
jgi:hypothetical protein